MSERGKPVSKSFLKSDRWRVIDNLLDAVFIVDRDGRLFYVNESFRQLCDIPRRAMISHELASKYVTLPQDCWAALKSGEGDVTNANGNSVEFQRYREIDFKSANGHDGRAQILVDVIQDPDIANEKLYLFIIRDVTVEARLHIKYRAQIQSNEKLIEELRNNLLQTAFLRRLATDLPLHVETNALLVEIAVRLRNEIGFRDAYFFQMPQGPDGAMEPLMADRRMGSRMREVARSISTKMDGVYEPEGVTSVRFEPFGTFWITPLRPSHGESVVLITGTGIDSSETDYKPFLQTLATQVTTLINSRSLYHASITDPLTGLFNRRFFDSQMITELEKAIDCSAPLTLLMIDIDHFKKVNDTYGHQAGDAILRELGQLIKRRIRNSDFGARIGGEEFALVLPDTSASDARVVAESLLKLVSEMTVSIPGPRPGETKELAVTISIGLSGTDLCSSTETCSPDVLYKMADEALYAAKSGGRNRYVISPNEHQESTAS